VVSGLPPTPQDIAVKSVAYGYRRCRRIQSAVALSRARAGTAAMFLAEAVEGLRVD